MKIARALISDKKDKSNQKRRKYKYKLFKNNNSKAIGEALKRRGNWEEVLINLI